ncbi:MAG: tRNA (adenosine(37)-N6)-dimethylallyltransferase MiaA [Planctomycetes bacterium RBG_16_64_12]|nr:MAG: tRNA (adenosine(37)-N6)-dimethylallyltransferase MiaA [Planctomycetes bacterium RBG_16_64_12]
MSLSPVLDCWFLTGPTAGGKTGVGIELAGRIGAEIVSLDSMALYRGMDIGTAKPTPAERLAAAHHLVDVVEPHGEFSLAQYLEAAGSAIRQIRERGREVLFVGGTPLYLKGLLRGIFRGPPADWEFRRQLEDEARREGPEHLLRRLAEVDPVAATRLHPNDTRRLVRALEVYEKTGRPISEVQEQFDTGCPADACRVFVLDWPTAQLNRRIDRRVEAMFAAGLVEEVRSLLDQPRPLSKTAAQALGYREVIEHLQGRRDLVETIELVKTRTRQFAKRQRTWFRSLSECRFVRVEDPIDPAEVALRIAEAGLRQSS